MGLGEAVSMSLRGGRRAGGDRAPSCAAPPRRASSPTTRAAIELHLSRRARLARGRRALEMAIFDLRASARAGRSCGAAGRAGPLQRDALLRARRRGRARRPRPGRSCGFDHVQAEGRRRGRRRAGARRCARPSATRRGSGSTPTVPGPRGGDAHPGRARAARRSSSASSPSPALEEMARRARSDRDPARGRRERREPDGRRRAARARRLRPRDAEAREGRRTAARPSAATGPADLPLERARGPGGDRRRRPGRGGDGRRRHGRRRRPRPRDPAALRRDGRRLAGPRSATGRSHSRRARAWASSSTRTALERHRLW